MQKKIIGLDIGISSTKIVAFVAKKLNKAEICEGGWLQLRALAERGFVGGREIEQKEFKNE